MKTKVMAWGLTAVLLTAALSGLAGCSKAGQSGLAGEEGTQPIITLIRTKTPQAPYDENQFQTIQKPGQQEGEHGGEQGDHQSVSEMGEGAELDGYVQLLSSIDREKLSGPDGWNRHSVGCLFDGIFETTGQGTNKYGMDKTAFTVSWQLKEPLILNAYTLVTGSDTANFPDRNPEKWTVSASEDGKNWVVLDSVEAAGLPAENYTPVTFKIENDQPYRYYQWNVEACVGTGSFQAAELLLYTLADNEIQPTPEGASSVYPSLPKYGAAADSAKEGAPLTGKEAADFLAAHRSLQGLVLPASLYFDADPYGDGPVENLFDGIYTREDFESNGGGKTGGTGAQAHIVWKMSRDVTAASYVLVTGNDTSAYSDRNPLAWTLYGSADGKDWQLIDAISDGKLEAADFEPFVYTVESPKAYGYYCLVLEQLTGSFQLCELLLLEE